jgi:hypothetical protein
MVTVAALSRASTYMKRTLLRALAGALFFVDLLHLAWFWWALFPWAGDFCSQGESYCNDATFALLVAGIFPQVLLLTLTALVVCLAIRVSRNERVSTPQS